MALFGNFNGMGPEGAQEPEPRTALGRFWQIYTRHSLGLLGAGILCAAAALVYIVSLFLGVTSHGLIFVLVGCPIGGAVAMPEIVGVADTVFRAIRGEAGFWWMKYKTAWKRNLKQSAIFGFFAGLLFGFQCFMLVHSQGAGILMFILMLLGICVSTAVAAWTVAQIALMELPTGRMLLNALVLSTRHPLKTAGVVVITVAYWLLHVVTYPFSLLFYVLFNFWFQMLICLMMLWRPLDEAFDITEKIDELNAKKRVEEKAAEEAADEPKEME